MKRRRWILLAVVGVVVGALLIAALWPGEKEPEYQGKKLSEWLIIYANSSHGIINGPVRDQAADAVRHIGTNALPFLVEWVDYGSPKWRTEFARVIDDTRFPFPRKRMDRMIKSRQERASLAGYGFWILREEAAQAAPTLSQMLQHVRFGERAIRLMVPLRSIGKNALPALVTVVTNRAADTQVRCEAARCLMDPQMDIGTNEVWAAPILLRCLDEPVVGPCVGRVLGVLKLAPEQVVPALVRRLSSPDPRTRREAAAALEIFGKKASAAVPDLVAAACDKDRFVRIMVTNALVRIAPQVLTNAAH